MSSKNPRFGSNSKHFIFGLKKQFTLASSIVIIVVVASISHGFDIGDFGAAMAVALQASNTTQENTAISGNNTSSANTSQKEGSTPNKQITLVAVDVELDIAPGKRVKAWTFNGTMPAPTIRMTEGENLTIRFINKTPIPHTIHFHGNHDDLNDGVLPQVMPGQTYLYNITGEPAGALMFHCHAPPTSLHIRMGMYGALIIDPKDKPLPPAKEFVMVMGEYSLKDQLGIDADYFLINGYADQYMRSPIEINQGDLLRLYVINMGTAIPSAFHLHSTTFLAYPSGLVGNPPIHAQTVNISPGDASIIEAKWKYPGTYLFHSHGIQEERGNMGQINVVGTSGTYGDKNVEGIFHGHSINPDTNSTAASSSSLSSMQSGKTSNNKTSGPLTESESMFAWQYELQKKLQQPQIIDPSKHDKEQSTDIQEKDTQEIQEKGIQDSLSKDSTLATDETTATSNNANATTIQSDASGANAKEISVSIVPGAGDPNNKLFYKPADAQVEKGTTITWTNDDQTVPHTVTAGNSKTGPSGDFDSGILPSSEKFSHTFDNEGEYNYYCSIHPWMEGKVTVE